MAATAASPVQRVLVTRPEPEATPWAEALRARGWPAEPWPLMVIGPPDDPEAQAALRHWRERWHALDALMFVSAAAVSHFMDGATPPPAGSRVRFWAPGPGTARRVAAHIATWGLDATRIDAPPASADQFDSEHLWPVVATQMAPGRRVLIVRGTSDGADATPPAPGDALPGRGRDWLIAQCRAAGAEVDACVAYARHTPALDTHRRTQLAPLTTAGTVWLFSSSEALAPLAAHWPAGAQATALVTHPRIAEAARALGFGQVVTTRPTLDDVVRDLESLSRP